MRHGDRVKKLGRKKEHRHALIRNLCRALFIAERIKTTLPKAKAARPLAERLVQYAKKNDLAAKRRIYRYIPDHKLVKVICDEIGPRFANRAGGYTRIYRIGPRTGDGAEMALLELVEQSEASVLAQRRKLIERRMLPEAGKEKKPQVKKKKEPGAKDKEKTKAEEKKEKPKKTPNTSGIKKKGK